MHQFNKYIHEGEAFIQEIANETETPWDLVRGHRFLRAVLHALRMRLTPSASLQLISQFPMLIKAIYVDGWKITDESQTLRTPGDFIEAVRAAGGVGLIAEFVTDNEVNKAIHAVFAVIKQHVSEGEIKDVLATLPAKLRPMLEQA